MLFRNVESTVVKMETKQKVWSLSGALIGGIIMFLIADTINAIILTVVLCGSIWAIWAYKIEDYLNQFKL